MASKRKSVKSDFSSEDETVNLQSANSPMKNKIPKLTRDEAFEGSSRIKTECSFKEKRVESYSDIIQNIFNDLVLQLTKRNKRFEDILIFLIDVTSQMKTKYKVNKENGQILKQLRNNSMKHLKAIKLIDQETLRELNEICNKCKTELDEIELKENYVDMQLIQILINQLYEKATADAKRSE